MAGERADILFRAELDTSGAITSLQAFKGDASTASTQTGAAFGSLQDKWASLAGAMSATAFLSGVVMALKNVTAAAAFAEVSATRLDAVVRASGGAAGYTTDQLLKMASRMQHLTGTSDEAVQAAETVLLTFQHIGHDVFPEALKASADLAAVMGTDMPSAARTLGMALENPEQGMMRLRRSGIMLSESVKNTIKDLWDQGRTLEAQNLLLAEIEKRVGGAAEALGTTFTGSLNKVKEAWSDVREEMGAFLTASEEGKGTLQDLATVLGMVADKLKEIRDLPGTAAGKAGGMSIVSGLLGGTVFGPALANLQQIQVVLGAIAASKAPADSALALVSSHAEAVVAGGGLDAAAAWKKIEVAIGEAIKRQDEYLKGQRSVTEASLESLKAVGKSLTESLAGDFSARFSVMGSESATKFGDAFMLKTDRTLTPFATYAAAKFGKYFSAGMDVELISPDAGKQVVFAAGTWGDDSAKVFANAFKDGFLAVLEGDDFKDPLKALFGGFAGMFAQAMGEQLQSVMSGKGLDTEALKKAGLMTPEGTLNAAGAAMLGGSLIAQYGMAQQNRGVAAAGGAIAGAGMAATMGATMSGAGIAGPWGLVIGAVVGAAMAYFSSAGPSAERAAMGLRGGRGYVTEITGGVNVEAERMVAQQITQRYQTAVMSFRDTLRKMDADLGKIPDVSLAFDQRTKSLQSAIDAFIKGTVPRAVFEAYKPALQDALTNLGVGADRIKEELQKFSDLDFDTAMAGFGRWISALVDITDVTELLLKTPEEMRAEVNRTMREGFLAGIDDVLDRAGELAADAGELFSAEQVANAEQLISLGKQQYQETLNYIAQLESVSKSLSDTLAGTLLGFEEERARSGGAESLGAFYQRQLDSLAQQLAGATSAEQVQTIFAQMAKFGQLLAGLGLQDIFGGGAGTPWGEAVVGTQEWVEQYLRAQEAAAQVLIEQWEKEAADRNAALASVMEQQRAALVAATEAAGALADSGRGAADGLDDLNDSAVGLSDSLRGMREQIDGLAGALAALGVGAGVGPEGAGRYA